MNILQKVWVVMDSFLVPFPLRLGHGSHLLLRMTPGVRLQEGLLWLCESLFHQSRH